MCSDNQVQKMDEGFVRGGGSFLVLGTENTEFFRREHFMSALCVTIVSSYEKRRIGTQIVQNNQHYNLSHITLIIILII